MNPEEFKKRTKAYSLRIIRWFEALPCNQPCRIFGRQLPRTGTSVGANYRAACRAKSRPDFITKMDIVAEECDESPYWMELLIESGQVKAPRLASLMNASDEILALTVASINTARWKLNGIPARKRPSKSATE